jgi:hypothetical protein
VQRGQEWIYHKTHLLPPRPHVNPLTKLTRSARSAVACGSGSRTIDPVARVLLLRRLAGLAESFVASAHSLAAAHAAEPISEPSAPPTAPLVALLPTVIAKPTTLIQITAGRRERPRGLGTHQCERLGRICAARP